MKFTLTSLLALSAAALSLAAPEAAVQASTSTLQRRDELSNFNDLVGVWWAALPNPSVIGAVSYEDDTATPLYSDVCFSFENAAGKNINQVFFHLTTYCSTFTDPPTPPSLSRDLRSSIAELPLLLPFTPSTSVNRTLDVESTPIINDLLSTFSPHVLREGEEESSPLEKFGVQSLPAADVAPGQPVSFMQSTQKI
ncbi:hypothetical protein BCR35DRAFT_316507 [Leucosporidium creatinivorum]|uniref:Lipocalin-like domain-containing protein n=1 Tax=Leucosporidium creatinivorum TaxID=106004 RepID=A0A1Y2BY92_9BASI|nr:hypothetical protein BCR35DRAFT_316507 [Leucosporidium creatinivorum]